MAKWIGEKDLNSIGNVVVVAWLNLKYRQIRWQGSKFLIPPMALRFLGMLIWISVGVG
jgi:hypothetical protein